MKSKRWPSFDVETLVPLNSDELAEIDSACDEFNEAFNSVLGRYRYQWNASPLNLRDLDYDFYEFGGAHWYRDSGYGFTCAFGQILVKSFGFQWMKMGGAESLRDWVLANEDGFYKFFPWQSLWSIVESGGNQFKKAEGTWMRILDQVDAIYPLPTGWHIIPDALTGEIDWVPKRVAAEMRSIYSHPEWHFGVLGLQPYEWPCQTDWDDVQQYLKAKKVEMDSWSSDA